MLICDQQLIVDEKTAPGADHLRVRGTCCLRYKYGEGQSGSLVLRSRKLRLKDIRFIAITLSKQHFCLFQERKQIRSS
ncbi:hypothetical protein D9M68_889510 [compost metagenome]